MLVQLPLTEENRSALLYLGFYEMLPRDYDINHLTKYTVATGNKYFRPASDRAGHIEINLEDLYVCLFLDRLDEELKYKFIHRR